jgi:hypothetical protein
MAIDRPGAIDPHPKGRSTAESGGRRLFCFARNGAQRQGKIVVEGRCGQAIERAARPSARSAQRRTHGTAEPRQTRDEITPAPPSASADHAHGSAPRPPSPSRAASGVEAPARKKAARSRQPAWSRRQQPKTAQASRGHNGRPTGPSYLLQMPIEVTRSESKGRGRSCSFSPGTIAGFRSQHTMSSSRSEN